MIVPPLKEVPDPLQDIDRALTRTLRDPFISEADRARVHALLERLPPSQYRGVLERMERSGSLERYLGDLAPEDLARFIQQGVDKRLLRRDTGTPHGARWDPDGRPFQPPAIPAHFRPEPGTELPGPVLGAIIRHNNQLIRDYDRAYEAYVDRFAAGVREVGDPDSLRRLGEIVKPHPFIEVEPHKGVRRQPSYLDAELAWSLKATRLRGEIPAGPSLEGFVEVTYKEKHGDDFLAVKQKGSLTLERDLALEGKASTTFTTGLGVLKGNEEYRNAVAGVQASIDEKGELKAVGAYVDAKGFSATASVNDQAKLELTGTAGDAVAVGARVSFDPGNNRVGFGPVVRAKVDDLSVTAGLMAHFRGLRDDAGIRAVTWRREIDPPGELRAGLQWEELSADRQLQLRATWSPQEWNRLAATARRGE